MNISSVRQFNRFYTRVLGVFDHKVFGLDYSMVEMRVLGEISRMPDIPAKVLAAYLQIDKSYLSRIIKKLAHDGYITREKKQSDQRVYSLQLTEKGKILHAYVEEKSDEKIIELLKMLTQTEQERLFNAMETIEEVLTKSVITELEA